MPLSAFAINEFVGRDISQITECRAVRLADQAVAAENWLPHFILNRIFTAPIDKERASLAVLVIRRTAAALDEYNLAVEHLETFAANKSINAYFASLRHFEASISFTWQAHDYIRRALAIRLFEPKDGSDFERLNLIYNRCRHADPQQLPADQLHPIWVTIEGLATDGALLSFLELREILVAICSIADRIARLDRPQP